MSPHEQEPALRLLGPDEVEDLTSGVPGWLSSTEGRLLYELAQRATAGGCIVEIGSWQGKSTIWLAAGARSGSGARVVAIDPHRGTRLHHEGEDTEQALLANLEACGLRGQVEVVVATSREAARGWTRPVSLLWIDGDHAYESAREDFLLWEKHLVEGGVVALHDTLYWDGPVRVVKEFLQRLRRYSGLGFVDTITYATKRRRPTAIQTLRKRIAVAHHYVYAIEASAAPDPFHVADLLNGLRRLRAVGTVRPRRSTER